MKQKLSIALIFLVLGVAAGFLIARHQYAPQPQPDNRTALQKKLFQPGRDERTIHSHTPGAAGIGWRVRTDCTGAIYARAWSSFGEDIQEWVADSDGRLREYRKTQFSGGFPMKRVLSDGVVQPISYEEKPSGIAKADWEVIILPRQATENGIDGVPYQESFDSLIEFLAKSRDEL